MASSQFGGAGHEIIGLLDITGDGRADLVTASSTGNAYVYRGTSTGAFASGVASFAGTLNSAHDDGIGHELVSEGPIVRRRRCAPSGCRLP